MTPEEAILVFQQIGEKYVGTAAEHRTIQEALQTISAAINSPKEPEVPAEE